MGRDLLATSLRRIRLCVDTVNPRLYPMVRRGGRFDEVVENIRAFLELSKGKPIKVEIQRLITPETSQESVRSIGEYFHLDRYPQAEVIEKTCEPLDTSDETPLHQSFYGCFQGYPFNWFIVLADGRVTHCCYDAHGQQPIGDMRTQTVREIVDSAKVDATMAAFKAKDWADAAALRRVLQERRRPAAVLRPAHPARPPPRPRHSDQAAGPPVDQPLRPATQPS